MKVTVSQCHAASTWIPNYLINQQKQVSSVTFNSIYWWWWWNWLLSGLRKLLSFLWRNTTMSTSTSLPRIYVSVSCMEAAKHWTAQFPRVYSLEWRQSVKWLSGNCLPNAHAILSDVCSSWFLGADFKELLKTASVLVLRWWLQFRSLHGSTSCKKLNLLLYRHVYPAWES